MKSILLTVHTVQIKTVNGPRNAFQLIDSFSDKEADLYDVLREILEARKTDAYRADDSQQALQVKRLTAGKRQIEGQLDAGHFGSESEIRNLNEWKKVAYNKRKLDVDLQPFYFLFDLPEGKDRGFLVSQSTGVDGVQILLSKMLHEHFVKDFPDDRLRFHPIAPGALKKELAKGHLSEVRFIRHRVPRDIAAVIGPAGTDQTTGTMHLVMRFEEDGIASEIVRQFVDKQRGAKSILELEGIEFPYDNVKIKVKLHGKERTVDLGAPDKIRPSYEVTERVELSPAGHPKFASISEAAKELLDDVKATLYGKA